MQSSFLTTALNPKVMRPALKIALLVGTVLVLINHGSALLQGQLDSARVLQILLKQEFILLTGLFYAVS